ncbi:DUF4190 domain-containing protein [Agromyces sp. H66]|uniref:DUF4190 domain-containing protein n=1 Tax=Agromyces sp. H66 TaxID=2529859 RepID=UPI0010AAC547|nr:DUF4190 domain-containing protein [Agromyces sp. H66]
MTDQPNPYQSNPYQPNPYQPAVSAGWHLESATNRYRWWDGSNWGVYYDQMPAGYAAPAPQGAVFGAGAGAGTNGFAVAALVLGIWGFLTTWIPLFIGLFLGGVPDVLAIVFGIIGIVRANASGGRGLAMSVVGLVLGGLAFVSIFLGAGTIW